MPVERNLQWTLPLPPLSLSSQYRGELEDPRVLEFPTLAVSEKFGFLELRLNASLEILNHENVWLRLTEPEGHGNQILEQIQASDISIGNLRMAGLTWKDRGVLEYLTGSTSPKILFPNSSRDQSTDGVHYRPHLIASLLSDNASDAFLQECDLLLARHILEHVPDPEAFLQILCQKTATSAILVLEVPDESAHILRRDYSMLWEEHLSYFSLTSLGNLLRATGWEIRSLQQIEVQNEDVISVVAGKAPRQRAFHAPIWARDNELDVFHYLSDFHRVRESVQHRLEAACVDGWTVFVGANHRTSNFLDLFSVRRGKVQVIDQNPNKIGKVMGLSGCPVVSPAGISWGEVKLVINCIRSGIPTSMKLPVSNDERDSKHAIWVGSFASLVS